MPLRPMRKKNKVQVSTETKGAREDIQTKDFGAGSAKTDGTVATYGTGYTLSGHFQAVNVRVEVSLPTTLTKLDVTMKKAIKMAEHYAAKRVKPSKQLLNELITLRKSQGG